MQRVSSNEEEWTLHQFYEELFNFCFPIDNRMQLRKSLTRCHQNDKSVTEYTHELQELFNMIGDVPERDRVLKFWNSSQPVIQKGLWQDNLNPETSSWDRVIAQAEIIEISENVADHRDRQTNNTSASGGSVSNPNGSRNRRNGSSGHSAVLLTPPLIPKESRNSGNSKNMDILQIIPGIPGIYTNRILNFLHYIFNFGA